MLKKIFLLLLVFFSFLFVVKISNNIIVDDLNKDTFEKYVREKILEKDSENRGFSDIVKKNIDDYFHDEETRGQFYKYAKYTRLALLAKTEEEFLEYKYKLNLISGCKIYLMETKKYKYDSEKMKYLYADNYKMLKIVDKVAELHFSNIDLMDKVWKNFEEKKRIFYKEDYDKYCQ